MTTPMQFDLPFVGFYNTIHSDYYPLEVYQAILDPELAQDK